MKSFNILLVFFLFSLTAFWTNLYAQEEDLSDSEEKWQDYGELVDIQDPKSGKEALKIFEDLESSAAAEMQLKGEVAAVCQMKGCWMIVQLADGQQTRISFKDYGFFVPKDIAGKEVVVQGIASVEEISEADQKHYAKDAGLADSEIEKIKGSKRTYSMVAEGVLIKE